MQKAQTEAYATRSMPNDNSGPSAILSCAAARLSSNNLELPGKQVAPHPSTQASLGMLLFSPHSWKRKRNKTLKSRHRQNLLHEVLPSLDEQKDNLVVNLMLAWLSLLHTFMGTRFEKASCQSASNDVDLQQTLPT